jgi:hypothetical protein
MMSPAGPALATALLAATLLAGCASSGRGDGATAQAFHRALKAAACMRTHGAPDYPTPRLVKGTIRVTFTVSVNPSTPAIRKAAKACGEQAEQQAGETSSRIAFVRCVRAHGVKSFPYPTASGHVSPAIVKAAGIDINSPAVTRVVSECLPPWLLPGNGP